MRGGSALLVIGAAMMVVALCFAAAVGAFAVRQGASTQAVAPESAAPVEATPSEPIVGLRGTKSPNMAEPESATKPIKPSAPSPAPAPEPAPQIEGSSLVGKVPRADTTTQVDVKTCEGDTFTLNAAEKKMLELHNQARTQRGLEPLCLSPALTSLARARSEDMLERGYFSHYTPEGVTVVDKMKRLGYFGLNGYHMAGENIAKGGDGTDTDTPEYMFDELMHSPDHRENILREGFTEVGIGARSGTYQHYNDMATIYTVVFGGRSY